MNIDRNRECIDDFRPRGRALVECFDKDGNLKWRVEGPNLVVNVGKDDILEQYFNGSTYTASHFVGLTESSPTPAAADTMASHGGWTEDQNYSEGTRPAYNPGAAASQSIDNSASKASFSINAGTTLGGAFVTTNSTKGGTTGTLVSVIAFTGGNQAVSNGDTVNVTYTYNT